METALGVGIIGVGHMGRMYARLLKEIPQLRLAGVADINQELEEAVAAEHGVKAYGGFEPMLDDPGIDAVIIAVHDREHREPTIRALENGKHVFLEKPLATDLADGAAMVEAAEKGKGLLFVAHTLRFDPRYVAAREAVASGRIGKLLHVYTRRNSWRSLSGRVAKWSSLPFFLGIHDIDMLHWVTGQKITSVFARGVQVLQEEQYDSVVASIAFEGGAIGSMEMTWSLPDVPGDRQSPMLEVVGTEGFVHVNLSQQGVSIHTPGGPAIPDFWYSFEPFYHGRMLGVYKEELLHFQRAIQSGEPLAITPAEALDAVRVALAMEDSLKENREISI